MKEKILYCVVIGAITGMISALSAFMFFALQKALVKYSQHSSSIDPIDQWPYVKVFFGIWCFTGGLMVVLIMLKKVGLITFSSN